MPCKPAEDNIALVVIIQYFIPAPHLLTQRDIEVECEKESNDRPNPVTAKVQDCTVQ